jgi:hypothetical protein
MVSGQIMALEHTLSIWYQISSFLYVPLSYTYKEYDMSV